MKQNNHRKQFFSFYKPYKGMLAADIVCSVIVAVIALLLPLCIRNITKGASAEVIQISDIFKTGILMFFLILIQSLCALYYDAAGHSMGANIERDMRNILFGKFQELPFSFYNKEKTGALMSRISNDLLSLAELYHHGPENMLIYSLQFIGALLFLFHINAGLTLIVCCFLPIIAIYCYYFNKKLRIAYRKNYKRISEINAAVEDNLSGIRVVKSFANEEMETKKFRAVNQEFLSSRIGIYKHEAYFYTGMQYFFTQLITAAIIVSGGIFITRASLDLADLISFLLYVGYLTAPIPKLGQIVQQFQEGFAGFGRFMEIMEMSEEPYQEDGSNCVSRLKGRIDFENVSFRYDEGMEEVLKDVSFSVKEGEYVALVGSSGVGKSTLCSLIPRFYEVCGGRILIDGMDIKDIQLPSLRRNIGMVLQDVYLFAGTVLENIQYGKPEAGMDEIIEAATKANAHEFIMELPEGYHTYVGQRGVILSGGQKQRISIARVFLKNPPILIFDEATSALDNENERAIYDSLFQLAKNRTTIVVAHRLSTIRNAERILVLSGQSLAEQGKHEELLKQDGIYAGLYQAQMGRQ